MPGHRNSVTNKVAFKAKHYNLAKLNEKVDDSWRAKPERFEEVQNEDGTISRYKVPRWEEAFLAQVRLTGTLRKACKKIGLSRDQVYDHRTYSPLFAQRMANAIADFNDFIFEEATRRALVGNTTEIYDGEGNLTETRVIQSDRLLETMLKATHPEIFSNKTQVDVNIHNQPQIFLPSVDEEPLKPVLPSSILDPDSVGTIEGRLLSPETGDKDGSV